MTDCYRLINQIVLTAKLDTTLPKQLDTDNYFARYVILGNSRKALPKLSQAYQIQVGVGCGQYTDITKYPIYLGIRTGRSVTNQDGADLESFLRGGLGSEFQDPNVWRGRGSNLVENFWPLYQEFGPFPSFLVENDFDSLCAEIDGTTKALIEKVKALLSH
jgi:hypothetical protein